MNYINLIYSHLQNLKHNIFVTQLNAEKVFLFLSLSFGITFLIVTPPFQTPDEFNHFFRAYQISEGKFTSEIHDNRIGGYIPSSLVEFSTPFIDIHWSIHSKTSYRFIFEQSKIKLDPSKKTFVDLPNTALYSPLSYLSQAFSIFCLRCLLLPPFYIYYLSKLFSLLFWITCIYISIKVIPFYKWVFCLIALLPMSLLISISLSADIMTNAIAFLFIALVLNQLNKKGILTFHIYLIICLLSIFLAFSKFIYVPIVLLVLLLPRNKYLSRRTQYLWISFLFIITMAGVLFWSKIANSFYLPYSAYNAQYRDNIALKPGADINLQIQYIINTGLYFEHIIFKSLMSGFRLYSEGYIGTFGWLEFGLPKWLIYGAYIVIVVTSISDGTKNYKLSINNRLIILSIFIIVVFLLLLSQYILWDIVGAQIIDNLQGRYFIPIFPLLLILLYQSKTYDFKTAQYVTILSSVVMLLITSNILYSRYFDASKFDVKMITCNCENVTKDGLFKTNIPNLFLGNGNAQCNEKSKSGLYSIKLSHRNQFGLTYQLHDCHPGDVIDAIVWRHGKVGALILAGVNNEFYFGESNSTMTDINGWQKLSINLVIPSRYNKNEVSVYLYNNEKDSVYFDDFSIRYKRFLH